MLRWKTERSDQSVTHPVSLHVFRTHRRAHCGLYGTSSTAIWCEMNGDSPHARDTEIWTRGRASRIKRIRDAYLYARQGKRGPDRRRLGRRDALRRRRPLGATHMHAEPASNTLCGFRRLAMPERDFHGRSLRNGTMFSVQTCSEGSDACRS